MTETIDLTIGSPSDPPPPVAVEAVSAASGSLSPYGRSIGSDEYRDAVGTWLRRRFGLTVSRDSLAACVGTKEFVGSLALHLGDLVSDRDVVLVPAVAYPTYADGAALAGCRVERVPMTDDWCLDLDAVPDAVAARARLLWVNSPGNPAGQVDDLQRVAAWARERDIVVCSDECYVEFGWGATPGSRSETIVSTGLDGVIALHSLSKRSNFAGGRVGAWVAAPELLEWLADRRRRLGLVVAGPMQAAGAAAWMDDEHVLAQRRRIERRLRTLVDALRSADCPAAMPAGGLYVWAPVTDGDAVARRLANLGVAVQPGSVYGPAGTNRIRLAAVRPDAEIDEAARRIAASDVFRS